MNKKFFSFACLLSAGFIVANEASDLASNASNQVANEVKTSKITAVARGFANGVTHKTVQGVNLVKSGAKKGAALTSSAVCSCASATNKYKYVIAPVVVAAAAVSAYKTNATFGKWVDGVLGFEDEEQEATV